MTENNQFVTNFNDVTLKDANGNVIDKDNISNKTTFTEKLKVGDIVKLKDVNYTVEVKFIDYDIPNVGVMNYAGSKIEIPSSRLVLFNQEDIEYKIENKQNHVR